MENGGNSSVLKDENPIVIKEQTCRIVETEKISSVINRFRLDILTFL